MVEDQEPAVRSATRNRRGDSRQFTKKDKEERDLYCKNHQLKLDDEARQKAFRLHIQRQKDLFAEHERRRTNERFFHFTQELLDTDIDRVRKSTIPPYSFQRFMQLPAEIQLRIWSMAARTVEPRVHCFVSMQKDAQQSGSGLYIYQHKGSSRIYAGLFLHEVPPTSLLSVLSVSKDSRKIARTVYTLLPYSSVQNKDPQAKTYYNTLYDSFYLGGSAWDEFKILVDLLIKLNTTRPLQGVVQRDLRQLLKIRNLIVDMTVFGATPVRVWAEFPQLEVLTIVFYPPPVITDHGFQDEQYEPVRKPQFIKPQRGSKFGKRADWILACAAKTLQDLRKEVPQWKIPTIKAVIRTCGQPEFDEEIEEQWDGEDGFGDYGMYISETPEKDGEARVDAQNQMIDPAGNIQHSTTSFSYGSAYSEDDEEDDDSLWYRQAAIRMSCKISSQHIRELKHKYHPGIERLILNNPCDDPWLSDSEGEEGLAAYKKYASGIVYDD